MLRVHATPLRPEDGSQLAEEVLEALRSQERAETEEHPIEAGAGLWGSP